MLRLLPTTTIKRSIPDQRLLIAGLFVAGALVFAFKALNRMPDFEVYWNAAHHAVEGSALYRPQDGHWLLKYLPAFAIVMIPFGLLPLGIAKAVWFFGSIVVLVVLLRTNLLVLPELRKPQWQILVGTIVVLGKFYVHELVLGQTNLLLVTVVVAALLAMKRQQEALAGVLIVIAVVLKPYAVILLPWLLARRQPASIISASIGMAITLLLPVVRYGFATTVQLHWDWWHTVVSSTEPNLLIPDNISWLAMYSRLLGPGPSAQMLTVGTAVVVLALVVYVYWLRRGVESPELLEAGLLLTLMPLVSPQGWDYVMLLATPAVMCLVNTEDRLPRWLRSLTLATLVVIGFSIYDVVGRTAYRAFMGRSGITLCFFVVIVALAALRQRRVA